MNKKQIKRTIKITQYSKSCPHPHCDKTITGSSEDMMLWNLSLHLNAKHGKLIKGGKKK